MENITEIFKLFHFSINKQIKFFFFYHKFTKTNLKKSQNGKTQKPKTATCTIQT